MSILHITNNSSARPIGASRRSSEVIGLQPTKTRAELDSSTVLKQIFYEYHPLIINSEEALQEALFVIGIALLTGPRSGAQPVIPPNLYSVVNEH